MMIKNTFLKLSLNYERRKPLKKYKVVSLDLFQTLVDVESRSQYIWKRILESNYTDELWKYYSELAHQEIISKFHNNLCLNDSFLTMSEIFFQCFSDLFNRENIGFCAKSAAKILMDEHNNATTYEESLEFIDKAKEKYKVCLVSDADNVMIRSHAEKMDFDNIFLSEDYRSYKGSKQAEIFAAILKHYNIKCDEIIHIGDSLSDVRGASRRNIDSCWINRERRMWKSEIRATYEVNNLRELYEVLDLEA